MLPHAMRALRAVAAGAAVVLVAAGVALAGNPGHFAVESNVLGSSNGLAYRSATWENADSNNIYAAAYCPGKRVVTGGGGDVGPTANDAWIIDSGPDFFDAIYVPQSPRKAWTTGVKNTAPPVTDVTGYAVCAKARGLQFIKKTKGVTVQGDTFGVMVRCPSGTSVTGGGFDSEGNIDETLVTAPFDSGDRGTKPDDGWRVRIIAAQDDRQVTARAICSRRLDLAYRQNSHDLGLGDSLAANCPSDAAVTGGGAAVKGNVGRLRQSIPEDRGTDPDDVPDDRWRSAANGGLSTSTWRVFAICKT
jgi:hypothetical protein